MASLVDCEHAINWSQTGLKFLKWIHVVFVVGWVCASIVAGFSEGWYHMFIMFLEPILIALEGDATNRVIIYKGHVLGDAKVTMRVIKFTLFIIFACAAVNVAHFVVSVIEAAQCTSIFCSNTFWFLVVFIIWLGLLIFLECVEFYFFYVYLQHIKVFDHVHRNTTKPVMTYRRINV